jgi:hypothetical protein
MAWHEQGEIAGSVPCDARRATAAPRLLTPKPLRVMPAALPLRKTTDKSGYRLTCHRLQYEKKGAIVPWEPVFLGLVACAIFAVTY